MRVISLFILMSLPFAAQAAEVNTQALWDQANGSFQAGKYDDAATGYQQLVAAGVATADVYFNLGTAELRAKHYGQAILSYERALRLSPEDADVAFNLAEAQKANVDKIVGVREEEPITEHIGARVPESAAGWAFLGAWTLFWAALIGRLFLPRIRGLLLGIGVASAAVALVSGVLFGLSAWVQGHVQYAVVTSPVTSVREGPAKTFKAAFEIHEGLKVRVVAEQQEFLRIRLPNGVEGWVAQGDVPVI